MVDIEFRRLNQEDWISVAEIYRQGIETGLATFQKDVPAWEDWDSSHLICCRIVACRGDEIIGWAALTHFSARSVYKGVAEVSVYVSIRHRGQKVGTRLLKKLISESEKEGFWTLQAGIFPENLTSIRIHENLGFKKVGVRKKIGKLNGIWRDIILLERRSNIVGK